MGNGETRPLQLVTMSFRGPYVRAVSLVGLQDIASSVGGDLLDLMQEIGIDPLALRDVDLLISYRSYISLLELCALRWNKPFLGLELTKRSPPEFPILGPIVMLANLVEDIEAFIKVSLQYWPLHTNGHTVKLITNAEDDKTVVMRHIADPFSFPARQHVELVVSMIIALSRVVTGNTHFSPKLVRFQHRKPDDDGPYQDLLGCPVEFGAEHTEGIFDTAFLKSKTKGRLKILMPLAHFYMDIRMKRMAVNDRSLKTALELAIPGIIGSGHCNADFVARSLNLSPKAMQRQLAEEGTHFKEILDRVRHRLALQMLEHSSAPVAHIAGLLDYSSSVPFNAAFRRWQKTTPLNYRKNFVQEI